MSTPPAVAVVVHPVPRSFTLVELSLPSTTNLGLLAVGLFTLFVLIALSTVGISGLKRRSDRIESRSRETVRNELFRRQAQVDPDWDRWIDSLSKTEREALKSVLERYLRLVEGSQRDTFLEVADVLDLGSRADAILDRSDIVPRLQALSTLSHLEYSVSKDRLFRTCSDAKETREAAARLLYERRGAYENAAEYGTRLLLWEGREPLSVYGLETLAVLNTGSNTPLLHEANEHVTTWSESTVVQVCLVLEHIEQIEADAPVEWLFPLLEHDEPSVRSAAIKAFKQHGWRSDVRDRTDVRSLIADDDPGVRQATYEVLTYWGDAEAREQLEWATITEDDERSQLVAVRGLVSLGTDQRDGQDAWPAGAWQWILAELEIRDHPSDFYSPKTEDLP